MLFSSNLFLFFFLPAVLLIYYLLDRRLRNGFLLLASLVFYAWGTGSFVVKMIASIGRSWSKRIEGTCEE